MTLLNTVCDFRVEGSDAEFSDTFQYKDQDRHFQLFII